MCVTHSHCECLQNISTKHTIHRRLEMPTDISFQTINNLWPLRQNQIEKLVFVFVISEAYYCVFMNGLILGNLSKINVC